MMQLTHMIKYLRGMGILHSEISRIRKALSPTFLETEGSPKVVVFTAIAMATTIFIARWYPAIIGDLSISCAWPSLACIIGALMTSMLTWHYVCRGYYDRARCVQLLDIPLWSAVPLLVAMYGNDAGVVAIAMGVHGVMGCHWARSIGSSYVFFGLVYLPPLVLLFLVDTYLWILCAGLLLVCISFLINRMNILQLQASEQQEAKRLHAVSRQSFKIAQARERSLINAKVRKLKRDLAPASMVRSMLRATGRDEDVAILCGSLDRTARFLRAMDASDESVPMCDIAELASFIAAERPWMSVSVDDTCDERTMYIHSADAIAVVDAVLCAADQSSVNSVEISSTVEDGLIILTMRLGGVRASSTVREIPPVVLRDGHHLETARDVLQRLGGNLHSVEYDGSTIVIVECPTAVH